MIAGESMLEVRDVAGKGRGVFARRRISGGEIIENVPVIVIPADQVAHIERTILDHYCFDWGKDAAQLAVLLGLGSIYNHSYQPNARYIRKIEDRVMQFVALRDIEASEEICVNYNGKPDDRTEIAFENGTWQRPVGDKRA